MSREQTCEDEEGEHERSNVGESSLEAGLPLVHGQGQLMDEPKPRIENGVAIIVGGGAVRIDEKIVQRDGQGDDRDGHEHRAVDAHQRQHTAEANLKAHIGLGDAQVQQGENVHPIEYYKHISGDNSSRTSPGVVPLSPQLQNIFGLGVVMKNVIVDDELAEELSPACDHRLHVGAHYEHLSDREHLTKCHLFLITSPECSP